MSMTVGRRAARRSVDATVRWLFGLILMLLALPAAAQNPTLSFPVVTAANLGRVAVGASQTPITLTATGTRSVGAGGAVLIGTVASNGAVSITCVSGSRCNQTFRARVWLAGSATNNRLTVTGYTVGNVSPIPSSTTGSGTTTLTLVFPPIGIGGTASFNIGVNGNILTTGNTGAATVLTRVSACAQTSCTPNSTSTALSRTLNVTLNAFRGITMASSSNLVFGRVVVPGSGSGTISISPTGVVSGTLFRQAGGPVRSQAQFTVSGEGGQSISVLVPATVTMTNGANSLTVTTSNNLVGSPSLQTLSGAANTTGTLAVAVGGTVTAPSTTPAGNYTGTLTVTASYN